MYNNRMKATINPILNGGEKKRERMECGCDPNNAELDEKGQKKILVTRVYPDAFKSLGLDMGLSWTYCCQCKEVFKIEAISTAPVDPLVRIS